MTQSVHLNLTPNTVKDGLYDIRLTLEEQRLILKHFGIIEFEDNRVWRHIHQLLVEASNYEV